MVKFIVQKQSGNEGWKWENDSRVEPSFEANWLGDEFECRPEAATREGLPEEAESWRSFVVPANPGNEKDERKRRIRKPGDGKSLLISWN